MRIALVIEHLDCRRGGAERYIHDFAAFLLGAGHQVQIVAQDAHDPPAGAQLRPTVAGGCPCCAVASRFADAAREALVELRPDVSLATGKALGMGVYQPHGGTVRGSQRQNAALVRSPNLRALKLLWNRVSPKHCAARRLEAEQFAQAGTHFVAVSNMVRRDMQTFYGLPDGRISVVCNGVDLERFHPDRGRARRDEIRRRFGAADETALLVFVAHNFKLKGLRELIAALGRLRTEAARPFHLLVVGRGRAGPYRRLARRAGVADRVTFAGAIENIAEMYGAADAFVHPTWYDPCSLVVLEALAAGLPVLTTRFNGAAELLDGRACGAVLDAPRPVGRLAESLKPLLDPSVRTGMSRAARAVAEEHPQQRNFREMLAVLQRAARSNR